MAVINIKKNYPGWECANTERHTKRITGIPICSREVIRLRGESQPCPKLELPIVIDLGFSTRRA